MPSIKFDAVVETSKALAGLNAIQSAIHQTSEQVKEDGDSIDSVVNKIKNGAVAIAGSWSAGQLVNKIMQVRGQFQQLEIAFSTMLGSGEKANELMTQLVHTAAITPFDLQGVANGAKQLLAYGISADEVNDVLIHLGDIAAGLSLPLGDLVYLYGTTMVQGRMFSMDLRQFMGRGIPLAEELAKQFGVTTDKVAGLVTAGKVGAEEFKKAIMSMSSEGSQFGGLMEAQSKSITGQIANIEDAVDVMFNNIGKSSEGLINGALGVVGDLVENYELVGKNLLAIAATYGSYKAALIAVNVVQNIHKALIEESAVQMAIAKAQGIALSQAEAVAAAKTALHTAALNQLRVAMNAVKAASPYLLIAAAVATLAFTLANVKSMQEQVNEAYDKYIDEKEKAIEKEKEHQSYIENLISIAGDESMSTDLRREALIRLEQQYPSIFAKYKTEADELAHIRDIKREIAALDGKASLSNPKNELNSVTRRIKELEGKGAATYTSISTTAGNMSKQSGGRTEKEEAELQALKKRQTELKKAVAKDTVNSYLSNLSGVSATQLQREIDNIDNVLAQLSIMKQPNNKTKKGIVRVGGIVGKYTVSELQGMKQQLEREQADRLTATTASDFKAQRKKELDAARKALADFDKSSKTMKTSEIEAQRQKLQTAVDEAEKAYKALGGSTKKGSSQNSAADKRKAAEEALGEQLLSLEHENAEKELAIQEESTEQKLKQIDEDYKKRIDEINKQEKKFKENNKKAGNAEALTAEQQAAIDNAKRIAQETKDKQTQDIQKEAIESMRNYLKEYGSFEQQRLAITEEYEEKIAKAATEGEKLTLQKERDQKLGALEYSNIASGIDWRALFSGVGSLSKEMMQPMMDKLMAYTKTDEYKVADSQTQRDVASLIQELRQYLGTDQSMTWQALGTATENFISAVGMYNKAVENERASVQRLAQAKLDLKEGKISQSEFDKIKEETDKFGRATTDARDNMQSFATTLNDTSEQIANFTSPLTAALNKAKSWQGVDGFGSVQQSIAQVDAFKGALDSALPSMGDGIGKTISEGLSSSIGSTLSSLGSGLSSVLSSGLGQAVGFVAQLPRLVLNLVAGVKGFVVGVIDSLTELVSLRWIDDLVTSICDAVGNLVDALFDLPENLAKMLSGIVVNGVGNLLNSVIGRVGNILTFGLLDSGGPFSWLGWSDNTEKMQKKIDELNDHNEVLSKAMESLTDALNEATAVEAGDVASSMKETQRAMEKNASEAMINEANKHGTWRYSLNSSVGDNKGWKEAMAQVSAILGKTVTTSQDFLRLTADEMKEILEYDNGELLNKILAEYRAEGGKGGRSDQLPTMILKYIETYAGEIEGIEDELREKITGTTADDVFDNFMDSLLDLANGSEDVMDDIADNWQEMINKMLLSNVIGGKYKQKLQEWYENWYKAYADDKNLSSTEIEKLREEYNSLIQSAASEVEALRDAGLVKATEEYSQTATSGGFESMGQDTADELNGRFTALQIAGESIASNMTNTIEQMQSIVNLGISTNGAVLDIRNMMVMTNSFLEDVAKYSKLAYTDFGTKLDAVYTRLKEI